MPVHFGLEQITIPARQTQKIIGRTEDHILCRTPRQGDGMIEQIDWYCGNGTTRAMYDVELLGQ